VLTRRIWRQAGSWSSTPDISGLAAQNNWYKTAGTHR